MPVHSAALLAHREAEVFLVHMGGPFWASRNAGAWTIPKGEYNPAEEDGVAAAMREFEEEVGVAWTGELHLLGTFRAGRKIITVHMGAAPPGLRFVASNEFALEWPPGSGRVRHFPEADRGDWFGLDTARGIVVASQAPILDAFREYLST